MGGKVLPEPVENKWKISVTWLFGALARIQMRFHNTSAPWLLTASGEPPIHELQHLHWNSLLVKILAFEPTTNRKFFINTIDALIFKSDDDGTLAARLVPNKVPDFKIGVH